MADGLTSLSSLNFGTSTGGAAGSAETTLTLGQDRKDVQTPVDVYHLWNQQISQVKNFCILVSQYLKGGTRLQVLPQNSNPFGSSEAGFYIDGSGNPKCSYNGVVTTLGSGGGTQGGTTSASFVPYASGANTLSNSAISYDAANPYGVAFKTAAPDSSHGIALKADVSGLGGTWFVRQNSFGYDINGTLYLFGDATALRPATDGLLASGATTSRWSSSSANWYDYKIGAQLTAATTITPTCGMHHVTGATTITNIALTNVPSSGNVTITLIADSTITFSAAATSGGIKVAPSATLASGKAMTFVLDTSTSLWYPVQGA